MFVYWRVKVFSFNWLHPFNSFFQWGHVTCLWIYWGNYGQLIYVVCILSARHLLYLFFFDAGMCQLAMLAIWSNPNEPKTYLIHVARTRSWRFTCKQDWYSFIGSRRHGAEELEKNQATEQKRWICSLWGATVGEKGETPMWGCDWCALIINWFDMFFDEWW